MSVDLERLAAQVEKLSPSQLLTMAAQLIGLGREDMAEMIAQKAIDKLAAKRLGLRT